jgi:hypothetical protein
MEITEIKRCVVGLFMYTSRKLRLEEWRVVQFTAVLVSTVYVLLQVL